MKPNKKPNSSVVLAIYWERQISAQQQHVGIVATTLDDTNTEHHHCGVLLDSAEGQDLDTGSFFSLKLPQCERTERWQGQVIDELGMLS